MDTFGVKFTPKKLAALKAKLAKHNDDTIVFEGKEWLVEYALYLVEYLTGLFMAKELKGEPMEYEGKE